MKKYLFGLLLLPLVSTEATSLECTRTQYDGTQAKVQIKVGKESLALIQDMTCDLDHNEILIKSAQFVGAPAGFVSPGQNYRLSLSQAGTPPRMVLSPTVPALGFIGLTSLQGFEFRMKNQTTGEEYTAIGDYFFLRIDRELKQGFGTSGLTSYDKRVFRWNLYSTSSQRRVATEQFFPSPRCLSQP